MISPCVRIISPSVLNVLSCTAHSRYTAKTLHSVLTGEPAADQKSLETKNVFFSLKIVEKCILLGETVNFAPSGHDSSTLAMHL